MQKKNRLKTEKWAEGKPLFTSIMAVEIAIGIPEYFRYIQAIRQGTLDNNYSEISSIKDWIQFYKNHRPLYRNILNNFLLIGGPAKIGAEFQHLLIEINKRSKELLFRKQNQNTIKNLNELFDFFIDKTVGRKKFLEDFSAKILADIKNVEDKDETSRIQEVIKCPEMLFFIKVIVPCWLFYRINPTILLYKARHGHEESIDQLLRLDKITIADPLLAEHFYQSLLLKSPANNIFLKALQNYPRKRPSLRNLKFFFSGLISIFSEVAGSRLFEPDIRKLFDSLAIDSGQDEYMDTDLPFDPATFTRAINRERDFWLPFIQPDKK